MIKRKGDKLYIKWKGCDISFNSWINKKDFVSFHQLYKNESIPSKAL